MNNTYEISIWKDKYNSATKSYEESKVVIIGSNTMTSQNRALEPKLVSSNNGTHSFSFKLYDQYIDNQSGEKIKNPFVSLLSNESKIKVYWKKKWYDFFVKQIQENQKEKSYIYSCEDAFITELGKSGFELEFDTELQNNIGTAEELIEKVIDGTDWQYKKGDTIYQLNEEPVYEITTLKQFSAKINPNQTVVSVPAGAKILVFYSNVSSDTDLKKNCQFYYANGEPWQQETNDMLVINGDCYEVDGEVDWKLNDNIVKAYLNGKHIFTIDRGKGVSLDYRAERMVQSQKSVYSKILKRYVNEYVDQSGKSVYGFNSTIYNTPEIIRNLITNPENFSSARGWYTDNEEGITFELYPSFNKDTKIENYITTSFLKVNKGITFNNGIKNNRTYLSDGFVAGEKFIFQVKAVTTLGGKYITKSDFIVPDIGLKDKDKYQLKISYFKINKTSYDSKTNIIEYEMECTQSCSYESLGSSINQIGLFINCTEGLYIETISFFKLAYGKIYQEDGSSVIERIEPGKMSIQSIAESAWKYYFASEEEKDIDSEELQYIAITEEESSQFTPVYNNFEKYSTIQAKQSNRFNILQSIAEAFKCWIWFEVEHDDSGHVLGKYVTIQKEVGNNTGVTFIYGIDLQSINRTLKSNEIATKTIVLANSNEFGKNGFCTIARSPENYSKENVIYNFDYYVQQNLIDKESLQNDLYNSSTGYYSQLHKNNTIYEEKSADLIQKKVEQVRQDANLQVYSQYISSAEEQLDKVKDDICKLAGLDSFSESKINNYLQNLFAEKKENKRVETLLHTYGTVRKSKEENEKLLKETETGLDILNKEIDSLTVELDTITKNNKTLNQNFYKKYARFIQEGTWSSEDYYDDTKYYLDALQVAYTSSRPQVEYDIKIMRLSDLDEYKGKIFDLNDICYIQDTDYFGYLSDKITPYKEQIFITEITSYFDTPEKDEIKTQNYKHGFDDLFQRITAATQSLTFSEGSYAKAANVIAADGTIKQGVLQNSFNNNSLSFGDTNNVQLDINGLTLVEPDGGNRLRLTAGGIFFSTDGGTTWRNGIECNGVNADILNAGRVNTKNITIYNGDQPTFQWDENGISAFDINESGQANFEKYVRFDKFGIYGIPDKANFSPTSEQDVYEKASFGLTWNKFFFKSSEGNGSLEISSDNDILIKEKNTDKKIIERVKIGNLSSGEYGILIKDGKDNSILRADSNGLSLGGGGIKSEDGVISIALGFQEDTSTYKFRVDSEGKLTANNAELTGEFSCGDTSAADHSAIKINNKGELVGSYAGVDLNSEGQTPTLWENISKIDFTARLWESGVGVYGLDSKASHGMRIVSGTGWTKPTGQDPDYPDAKLVNTDEWHSGILAIAVDDICIYQDHRTGKDPNDDDTTYTAWTCVNRSNVTIDGQQYDIVHGLICPHSTASRSSSNILSKTASINDSNLVMPEII